MNGLLTDLYELTMAAGYFGAGRHHDIGTFEFTIRRLPRNREFVLVAGLHRAVEYLLNLSFEPDEIAYLRGLENFRTVSPGFWDYLAEFRFTGDVFAVPEGTVLYEGQPVMNIRAPLIEAQIAGNLSAFRHHVRNPDRDQGRANRSCGRGPGCHRVRHTPRPHSGGGRARRESGLHRRLRRNQQCPRGLAVSAFR